MANETDEKRVGSTALTSRAHLKAITETIRKRFDGVDTSVMLVNLLDIVSEEALPALAQQFNIAGLRGFGLTNTC